MNKFWRMFLCGVLLSGLANAENAKPFKTFFTVENVSEDTSIDISLPNAKSLAVTQIKQKFEVPFSEVKGNSFKIVVQMKNKNMSSINPCEIIVEQVADYDRRYVCHTNQMGGEKQAAVEVRVFTNLHGGDKFRATQVLARR